MEGNGVETIEGKVILVTGGGRGLGAEICRELSRNGAVVIPADIQSDLVEKMATELRESGQPSWPLHADISDEDQARLAIDQVVSRFGRLDILINNAGTDKTISIEEMAVEDWDRVLAVNLRAPFLLSKYAFPYMRQQGSGHIINIVSTASKRAWANASAYHASKWGLLGFSHALHVEGRPLRIKVTAVVVGGMRTPFLLDRFPDINLDNLQDPKNVAATIRFVLTQPQETVIPEIMVIPMRETSWP